MASSPKKKIKSKLARVMNEELVSSDAYFPTEEECIKWFRISNREIFDRKLPPFSRIEIRRRRHCWGECMGDEDDRGNRVSILSLNNKMKSKKHFIEVLIHEIIHHWEYINYGTMGHGEKFHSWKDKLAGFDIKLREIPHH